MECKHGTSNSNRRKGLTWLSGGSSTDFGRLESAVEMILQQTALTPKEINNLLEIPSWDTVSAIKVNEAEFIYNFIKEHRLEKTLETGFAFARSASHIMAATGKAHIACDPFQDHYANMGLKNIERLGLREKLDFRADYSHNVLPQLALEKRKFDFVFVDGDHKFDGILVDFYYANLVLEVGGYVLMHDTWMRSTRLVENYVRKNMGHFTYIPTPLRNFSLFRKNAEDSRDGMVFREFYNLRSIMAHRLINWMANGKKSALKSLALKIKDLVK